MFSIESRRRLPALCVALLVVGLLSAANTGPITRLTISKDADIVPLFDGVATGQFQVRMSALDAYKSNVFVTNTTSEALNVALPKAMVGVHVLPQLNGNAFGNGNGFFGNNGNGNGASSNNTGGLSAIGNMAQSVGGQPQLFGGLNGGGGNSPLAGNGFPSVPPEWADEPDLDQYAGVVAVPSNKTIQFQLLTVCLNYGRPDPSPALPYQLTSVEKHTSDPALAELLESYSPRVDQQVMQASAWHVANGLNWEQLSQLPNRRLVGTSAKLFTARQVQAARTFVQGVQEQAAKRPQSVASQVPQVAKSGRAR